MTSRLAGRLPLLLTAAVLTVSLTACGSGEPDDVLPEMGDATAAPSTPSRVAMAAMELVRVETTGGMCPESECPSPTTVIYGDGGWQVTEGDMIREGRLSFDDLNEVIRLTTTTDPTAHPKDEQFCESWVDGQDVTVTYAPGYDSGATDKPVTVSSCDYDLSRSKVLEFVTEATA